MGAPESLEERDTCIGLARKRPLGDASIWSCDYESSGFDFEPPPNTETADLSSFRLEPPRRAIRFRPQAPAQCVFPRRGRRAEWRSSVESGRKLPLKSP